MGRDSGVTDASSFAALLQRIREGDALAAAEFVRLYEPAIRRAARLQMVDLRLRRVFDSMDICQAVLASFFMRAAAGQIVLEGPDDLLRFLVAITLDVLPDDLLGEATSCAVETDDPLCLARSRETADRQFRSTGPDPFARHFLALRTPSGFNRGHATATALSVSQRKHTPRHGTANRRQTSVDRLRTDFPVAGRNTDV
jgi:hypothetical protein